jgi:pyruvate dehydrogenase E2 component (dihydrolipoamide acetyltransferase)
MGVFAMPSLGADMEAGTLVEWLVKPGDRVAPGDVVAVVETQKGAIEIEIFEDGVIDRLEAQVGDKLPVGAPLARLRPPGAAPSEPEPRAEPVAAAAPATAPPPAEPAAPAEAHPPEPRAEAGLAPAGAPRRQASAARPAFAQIPAAGAAPGGPPASPAARRRAAEAGIDLAALTGTGPGGAILLADVEAAVAALPRPGIPPQPEAPARPAGKPGLDPEAMRAAIAAAMARSKREIPHYYLAHTIDLQRATDWLAATNAERPPERRLLMGALLVKAVALAALQVAGVNGHNDGAFRPAEAVHAGVAVALRGGGLIAPAIRDAQALAIDDLMAAMRDLVARARTGRLRSSEMTDGTITVSSMGETGVDALFGVIYPPQVALVGFGAPARRPWVVGEAVAARTVVTASLAADHRVSDGRLGARFLAEIGRQLQEPEGL